MDNKLDFILIGSQKCATTWLYDCLSEHSQLNFRNSKNEDGYYGGDMYKKNGDAWYFSQFSEQEETLKSCASVEYIEDLSIPEKVYELNPKIKILVSLRQPELRAISAYQWYVRKSFIPNLPMDQGIPLMIKHFYGEIQDEYSIHYKDIINRGFYKERLERFYKRFKTNQLKIVLFDDIQEDSLKVIREVSNFLNIDDSFVPNKITSIPKKNTGNNFLIKIQRTFPKSRVVGKIVDKGNQVLSEKKQNVDMKIRDKVRKDLRAIYQRPTHELLEYIADKDEIIKTKIEKNWM